jgi:hypothetical protein
MRRLLVGVAAVLVVGSVATVPAAAAPAADFSTATASLQLILAGTPIDVHAYVTERPDDPDVPTIKHVELCDNGQSIASADSEPDFNQWMMHDFHDVVLAPPGRHTLVAAASCFDGVQLDPDLHHTTVTVLDGSVPTAVESLYGGILRRSGDSGGRAAFTGRPLSRVAAAMLASPERRSVRVELELYEAFLGIPADPAGMAYWAERARVTSFSNAVVEALVVAEVQSGRAGSAYDAINYAYLGFLGRIASDSEVAYWRSYEQRHGLAGAVRFILGSPEARQHAVDVAYQLFLGRTPEPGAYRTWTAVTPDGLATDRMVQGIVTSPEYQQRFALSPG